MVKVLVIGGGFAGCCATHLLSDMGYSVTLVEKGSLLGGGCRTFFYGGHPYTYGPRHFLTKDEKLFDFLNKYVPMRRIPDHEFLTYIERDPGFYHFPIHRDDIDLMPDRDQILSELNQLDEDKVPSAKNLEEFWLLSVGSTLYSKFVESYSKKMWKIESNTELTEFSFTTKGVALKTGATKAAWTEAISAFPVKINGYDDYFDISTEKAEVHLNTTIEAYDLENYSVKINGEWFKYDIIINTISPDIVLNNVFGELRWIGREFFKIVLPVPEVLPPKIYFLYYANDEPFTRIVEYKKFYNYEASSTLIGLEIPSLKNKLYPYPTTKDRELAKKYLDILPDRVFSIGRAGSYRYLDIAPIIQQCMELVSQLKE
ncbi:MAG TPA: UDP-galactopyranose mutase [Planktothrix sp. UBA10369]|nr:UDP-galactopyranose mutase [Planktothrix sp. UBA10369]